MRRPLRLTSSPRWARSAVLWLRPDGLSDLDRVEDEVDAMLCAYLAWLWGTGSPTMRVLGDVETGYIVVPGTRLFPRYVRRDPWCATTSSTSSRQPSRA